MNKWESIPVSLFLFFDEHLRGKLKKNYHDLSLQNFKLCEKDEMTEKILRNYFTNL
jgi:hypothetical protein